MTQFMPDATDTPIAWDNYLDHECDRLPAVPAGAVFYEPVLLALKGRGGALKSAATRLRDAIGVAGPTGAATLLIAAPEAALLDALIAAPGDQEGAEVFVYRLYDAAHGTSGGVPAGMVVRDIGPPFPIMAEGDDMAHGLTVPTQAAPASDVPVVAVIDDGIGFLNERFRMRGAGENSAQTRFDGIWLQAPERGTGTGAAPEGIALGRVVEPAEIDAALADLSALEEGSFYHRLNAALYPASTRRASELSTSHGTAVLDLAAGRPELDASGDDPLLMAVQLPPRAIEDTSGARFEEHILMGLRWILARAALRHPGRPVVVNLSVGMLAGPKDGSHILEAQIERELSLFEARTGRRARVVIAFGNGLRNRQVARRSLAAGEEVTLGWRVSPDDRTANHLEVYAAKVGDLSLRLTDPQGRVLDAPDPAPAQGAATGGMARKTDTAALYRIAAQRGDGPRPCAARLAATIAATAPQGDQPPALAGLWQITVTNTGTVPMDTRLQIQRDDRVVGAEAGIRQSFFDGAGMEGEDSQLRDWNALPADGPVTEGGTHSALAGCLAPQVHTVGALMLAALRPAPYAAAGHTNGPVTGPGMSGVSDDGPILRGVLTAGTLSGSARLLNGTSAAAPQLTRALSQLKALRQPTSGDANADRAEELAELQISPDRLGWLVPQDMRAQLGDMAFAPNQYRSPRRMAGATPATG